MVSLLMMMEVIVSIAHNLSVGNVDDGSHHFVLNILVQNKYAICI